MLFSLEYKEVIFGQIETNWNARLQFQKDETANQSKGESNDATQNAP